jgi:hypothetical protein
MHGCFPARSSSEQDRALHPPFSRAASSKRERKEITTRKIQESIRSHDASTEKMLPSSQAAAGMGHPEGAAEQ